MEETQFCNLLEDLTGKVAIVTGFDDAATSPLTQAV